MTTRPWMKTLVCAALAAGVNVALADDAPKPKKPAGNTVDVKIDPNADDKITLIKPAPATKPAQDAVKARISPDARKIVDEVAAAYGKLTSLELAGNFGGVIEAAGQHGGGQVPFTASFQSPNKFRHDGKDDILIGSDGAKAYVFGVKDNLYITVDAPKEKVAGKDLPRGFHDILIDQNPSLRVALAKDPAEELLEDVTDVVRADDTKIADLNCPTLTLTLKDKSSVKLAIDPQTHLIRQSTHDVRAILEGRNIPDIKKAVYTVDYTKISSGGSLKAEQFAWAPPAGAKDAKDVKPAAAGADEAEPAMALVGKPAPDFKLDGMDGKAVSLADLKGKVSILDFWATWCGPCRASLPHLDTLYKEKKAAGLIVYAVNLQEEPGKIQEFVNQTKLSVPILLDTEGKIAGLYRAEGIPETVVIGKDGKVAKVIIGFGGDATAEELKAAVEEAMKK